jgi:hypothetical protein
MGNALRRAWRGLVRARDCGASGWRLRVGATDGNGGAVCPLCSRHVRTRLDSAERHPVEVIPTHAP